MELKHTFTVPVGADEAFEVLTDIERIAPCMPGAAVDSVDGDEFTGTVKVKVGPMQVTYRGKAAYTEQDRENHRAVIEARAQETRGSGTANATISASLDEKGEEETEVNVVSNLAITGRPAQFGRGVMNEVGSKLIGRFAECLSTKLSGTDEEEQASAEAEQAGEGAEQTVGAPAVGSNGSSAAASDQAITQQVGAAPPQPASGAAPAAAAAAPSSAAATSGATPAGSTAASSTTDTHAANQATTPTDTSGPDVEAIDLFEVAGPSVAKRAAPLAAVLLVVLFVLWRRRR